MKSKCCNAEVTTGGIGDFHDKDHVCTQYFQCAACSQPCDIAEDTMGGLMTEDQYHELADKADGIFSPEDIQAAIRGSNADQKAMMEKAKLTNKTNKLIELIQTIYTQKGNADSRGNLGVMLNDLVTTAREEERAEWKEKVKEATRLRMACACLKPNCEKDGWNSAMESVERSLLSNKEGYET